MADPVEHLIPLFGTRGRFDKEFKKREIPCGHHSLNEDAITDSHTSAVEKGLRGVADVAYTPSWSFTECLGESLKDSWTRCGLGMVWRSREAGPEPQRTRCDC